MRSMVVGLANSTSFASLSTIRKYVKPTTAKAVPRPCEAAEKVPFINN